MSVYVAYLTSGKKVELMSKSLSSAILAAQELYPDDPPKRVALSGEW